MEWEIERPFSSSRLQTVYAKGTLKAYGPMPGETGYIYSDCNISIPGVYYSLEQIDMAQQLAPSQLAELWRQAVANDQPYIFDSQIEKQIEQNASEYKQTVVERTKPKPSSPSYEERIDQTKLSNSSYQERVISDSSKQAELEREAVLSEVIKLRKQVNDLIVNVDRFETAITECSNILNDVKRYFKNI